jgi:uncharacterized membrane protein
VSGYSWLKLVHVLSAIVAVGTNVTYFIWLARAKQEPGHELSVLRGIRALDARLANPAYVVLPLTGVGMVLTSDLEFSTFWIALAIGLYVLMGVLAGVFFGPSLRRQVEIAQGEGARSQGYAAAARRTVLAGGITMVPIAAIVYLMVMKPTP